MGGIDGDGVGAPTESEFLSYIKSKGRVFSLKRGNGILNNKDFYEGKFYDSNNDLKKYGWEAIL